MKTANFICTFVTALGLLAPSANATLPEVDSAANPLVAVWADAVFNALDGRTWVLTDGSIDEWLVERAETREITLIPMPLRQGSEQTLDRFEDAVKKLGSDKLRAAAALGTVPFVSEWLASDPETAMQSLALLVEPAIIKTAGFEPLPVGVIHRVTRPEALTEDILNHALEQYMDIRDAFGEALATSPTNVVARPIIRRLRAQTALCGNNLGCLLFHADRKAQALDIFSLAYSLNREGYSPLLNMASIVREGLKPELMEQLGNEMNDILRSGSGSWNLASTSGFVLRPEDFFDAKWYWASSGLPGNDRAVLKAYLSKIEEEPLRTAVAHQLATALAMQSGGMQPALNLLADFPEDGFTSEFMLRIAAFHMMTGDRVRATRVVEQAAEAPGADPETVAFVKAAIYVRTGRVEAAVAAIEALKTDENASMMLNQIAIVYSEADQRPQLKETLEALARLDDAPKGTAKLAEAVTAQISGDFADAKQLCNEALAEGAKADYAYRTALMLDMMTDDKEAAAGHADALLERQPLDAFAHYVKATLAVENKNNQDAERHFQISLSQNAAWYVLNDYGAFAVHTGRHELAENLARNALDAGGEEYAAVWDTLGTALINQKRNAEAFEALKIAITKAGGDDPRIQLNFAELSLDKGDHEAATRALEAVDANKEMLSVEERERLGRLRRALEPKAE